MKVSSIITHNLELDRMQKVQQQDKREEDYRKVVERRNFERIVAERVARNIRLGLDKGRHIDVEC
jgi:phage terminase Nu1 subunit (DNA packaging protein)